MERLTEYKNGIADVVIPGVGHTYYPTAVEFARRRAMARLAEYEDVGLTPEEVMALKNQIHYCMDDGR